MEIGVVIDFGATPGGCRRTAILCRTVVAEAASARDIRFQWLAISASGKRSVVALWGERDMKRCLAFSTIVAVCLGAGASAVAATTDPATATPPTPIGRPAVDPRLDDQTMVCKRSDETGTRLGATKVCRTRGEWAGRAAEARRQMDRIQLTPQTFDSYGKIGAGPG